MGGDDRTRAIENNTQAQASTSASAVDADEFFPGTSIGAYIVQNMIASGGGGSVYFARHRLLGREAAVKVLRRSMAESPQMVQRFFREALAVNVIKHPSIVDIFEFGELPDRRPYYVMEHLEGTDVKTLLRERGRLTPAEALDILEPVCSALTAAHTAGFIHRDLKTSNIHIGKTNPGEKPTIKLLDFGVAKMLEPSPSEAGLTVAGTRLGTSQTMAPEQIDGRQVGPQTDVYALGVVLFQMLTGRYPFSAEDPTEVEMMHLTAPPPRPSQSAPVAAALDTVVLKSMDKSPDKRYPTASAFIEALREAVAGEKDSPGAAVAMKAVAVYVDTRAPDGQETTDEVLEESMMAIDEANQRLEEAGFKLPLQTGTAILGVKILTEGADAAERKAAIALANTIAQEFGETHPAIQTCVSVHAGEAQVRTGGNEILGGPIVSVAQWVPQQPSASVFVTPEASAGL